MKKTFKEKWFELKVWIENDITYWGEQYLKAEDTIDRAGLYSRISNDRLILDQMDRIEKDKLPWED